MEFFSNERELNRLNTAPEISATILANLNAWRTGAPQYIPPTNQWGEQTAALSQQRMGWTNFAFGRWHRQWSDSQQTYLSKHFPRRSSKRWTIAIIHKLYMTAWDLWDHRNKTLHAPGGQQAILEANQLAAAISDEYAQGTTGLQRVDRRLMQEPLEKILASTPSSQRKWLQSIRLARQLQQGNPDAAERHQRHDLQRQQTFMQNWLQPPREQGPSS